jgi:hypothetical protein
MSYRKMYCFGVPKRVTKSEGRYLPPTQPTHLPTYRLPPTTYHLPTYRLPPTTYHLPTYRLPPTAYRLPPTTYHLPPTTYQFPRDAPGLPPYIAYSFPDKPSRTIYYIYRYSRCSTCTHVYLYTCILVYLYTCILVWCTKPKPLIH